MRRPTAEVKGESNTDQGREPAQAGSGPPAPTEGTLNAQPPTFNAQHEADGAFEKCCLAYGLDAFEALDSDDIEWLIKEAQRATERRGSASVDSSVLKVEERALNSQPSTPNAGKGPLRSCPHCGTVFHPVSPYAEDCPSLGRHEERCAKASPTERAFYGAHRRWPRAGQVDADEEAA
jgi:hypothetical protein